MKQLQLTKPLVFLDTETTGLLIAKDRIIDIGMLKVYPIENGEQKIETKKWRVNPTVNIVPEVSQVHGITNEMVAGSPILREVAREILDFIDGDGSVLSDLGGYNIGKYDLPLIVEDFARHGFKFNMEGRKVIDALIIFHKNEPRDLTGAYKFYCGKSHDGAHGAEADTRVTFEVFLSQLERYEDLRNGGIDAAHAYYDAIPRVDLAGNLSIDKDGYYTYAIGKSPGKRIKDDLGFGTWMLTKDFPEETKLKLGKIISDINNGGTGMAPQRSSGQPAEKSDFPF